MIDSPYVKYVEIKGNSRISRKTENKEDACTWEVKKELSFRGKLYFWHYQSNLKVLKKCDEVIHMDLVYLNFQKL